MATIPQITTKNSPTWCPGCGDFTILSTVKNAIVELGIEPENVVIVSGIGCGSKLPHYVKVYGFEGLHGRALPVATGIKLANPNLHVIVVAGDGDCYGIGGNHFIHTLRRNLNVTLIVENNAVYGLTKGQTSPTSSKGFKSNSTPAGVIEEPFNPLSVAIAGGATYVARGYAMDLKHLKQLIVDGIKHNGFSLIDVFQQCPTYNKINTADWYKQNIYKLDDVSHNPEDYQAAFVKANETDKQPIGLFWKTEKPAYDQEQFERNNKASYVLRNINSIDIQPMLDKFS